MTSPDEPAATETTSGTQDEIGPPRRRPSRAASVNGNPWWILLVATMTVTGAAASVWAATGGTLDKDVPPVERTADPSQFAPLPPTSDDDPGGASPDDDAARSLKQGECLADDGSLAPCTAVHRYELVADAGEACDTNAAIEHLGGRPAVDMLLLAPEQLALPGGEEACVLGDPEGQTLTEPLADAFLRGTGARWRWCGDARSERAVPCSEPHTEEYVGTPAPAPDLAACQAAVETYLEARFARVADSLTVRVLPAQQGEQRPTCSVAARGTQVLTDTLRGIGAEALPLA